MIPAARAVLFTAALAHILHDGFSDVLYILLPLWASEFSLTLTGVGVLKAVYTAGMALSQIPAGILAERWGERRLLVVGTAVTALGYLGVATLASGMLPLAALLLVAGLGSGVQHPLASSLVSRAYETGPRRAALGTYNFAGDLGKIAVPAAVALVTTAIGWRYASGVYALLGLAGTVFIALALVRIGAGAAAPLAEERGTGGGGWGIRDMRGFQALSAIGMIDTATRTALLTFLPFLLLAKGLTVAGVGVALAVLFAGGAAGKFVCGLVAERVGIVRTVILTELATACGIVAVALGPLGGRPGGAPAARCRAERHVVGALRDGGRPRPPGAPRPRLRPLLHARRERIGGGPARSTARSATRWGSWPRSSSRRRWSS